MANNKETIEQLAQRLKLMDDIKKRREAINKLSDEDRESIIARNLLDGEALGQLQEIHDIRKISVENLNAEIVQLKEIAQLNENSYTKQQAKNLLKEAEAELQTKLIRQYEQEMKQGNTTNALELKKLKTLQAQSDAMDELYNLPGVRTMIKFWKSPGASMRALGVGALVNYGRAVTKLAFEIHNMEAAFMKATGASKDLAQSITGVYKETRAFGVTAADASAATQALYTGFTDFTFASEGQQKSLMKTGAVLGRMGISHQDFAASVQISTKALGMSTEAAGQNMLDMEKFAENLGVAPAEMAKQFAGAGNMMAKMGDQGVGAFKDLAIASKVSGMEIQKILTLTDKFDTFEGAAEMAGKLNAAMGGNFVNAMDMMMATNPAERFEMIRDSLDQAGLSFDDMSYYQKKFYADSLGLSDVSELALVMSGNMDLVSGSVEKSSQSIEDAAKRAQTMASFQEKLNGLFAAMLPIFSPLLDIFAKFVGWITESETRINTLLVVLGGLAVGLAALTLPISGTAAAIAGIVGGIGALAALLFSDNVGASTFLEGLTKVGGAFEGVSNAMDAVPDFMKKGAELAVSMSPAGVLAKGAAAIGGAPTHPIEKELARRQATETVRQPISIELKGDKLAEFVVEVVGEKVYEVNFA